MYIYMIFCTVLLCIYVCVSSCTGLKYLYMCVNLLCVAVLLVVASKEHALSPLLKVQEYKFTMVQNTLLINAKSVQCVRVCVCESVCIIISSEDYDVRCDFT